MMPLGFYRWITVAAMAVAILCLWALAHAPVQVMP